MLISNLPLLVTVYVGPNQLILVQATQDRYGAAMLEYVPVHIGIGCVECLLVPAPTIQSGFN